MALGIGGWRPQIASPPGDRRGSRARPSCISTGSGRLPMATRHDAVREGLIAGVLGATSVALWFLILDVIAGRAFHTPAILGTALLGVLGPAGSEGAVTHVIVYTLFHYAIFC